ncbi:MAG: hypothetical protein K9L61_00590 [Candidatus Omnitrophica bacterium]|nr:hypothetical protein [Candidatus Omnitrophota bacterium]
MKENRFLKAVVSVLVVVVFSTQLCFARSGVESMPEFEWGEFGKMAAISVVGLGVGSVVGGAFGGLTQGTGMINGASQAISGMSNFGFWGGAVGSLAVSSQINYAVGSYGRYHDWSNKDIYLTSSVLSGAAAGGINPQQALGSSEAWAQGFRGTLGGATTGALQSFAQAGTIVAIDGDAIEAGENPSPAAQVAGFAAGMTAGQIGRTAFNPNSWHAVKGVFKNNSSDKVSLEIRDGNNQTLELKNVGDEVTLGEAHDVLNNPEQHISGYQQGEDYKVTLKGSDSNISDTSLNNIESINDSIYLATDTKTGQAVSASQLEGYRDAGYDFRPTEGSNDVITVVDKTGPSFKAFAASVWDNAIVGRQLSNGQTIGLLENYPKIASYAAAVYAEDAIVGDDEDKQYLSPLIRGVASGVTEPLVSAARDAYGLRPSLYFSSHPTRIASRIQYNSYLYQSQHRIQAKSLKTRVNDIAKNSDSTEELVKKADTFIDSTGLGTEEVDFQLVDIRKKDLTDQELADVFTELKNSDKEAYEDLEFHDFVELSRQDPSTEVNMLELNRNIILTKVDHMVERDIKGDDFFVLNASFDNSLKFQVFRERAIKGGLYGLGTGLIDGGIRSAFAKNFDFQEDPAAAVMAGVAAHLGTAVFRGFSFYLSYEEAGDDWKKEWVLTRPEMQKVEGEGFLNREINRYAALERYENDLDMWQQFGGDSGVPITYREKKKIDPVSRKAYTESVAVRELEFTDQRSKLAQAMGASLIQASNNFAVNALSFGLPTQDPEHVSSSDFLNYMSTLSYLGSISRSNGANFLAYQVANAGIGSASSNVLTTSATMPGVRDFVGFAFGIQRQRFVQTISPTTPYTVQSLSADAATLSTDTLFWAPFDHHYGIRPGYGYSDKKVLDSLDIDNGDYSSLDKN